MKINKEWHQANPMPKNATIEQRIAWHLEHQVNCHCREIPDNLMEEIKKRSIKIPIPSEN
ncbi:MAG TPA: hypothetical protein VIM16_02175 [Mucilaginibacter sp.]|jgi:hypothetical protein